MLNTIDNTSNSPVFTTLIQTLGQEIIDFDGDSRPRQEMIARMVWDYLTYGEVTLPNGNKLTASSRDWIGTLKWLVLQVDGKPSRETPKSSPQAAKMEQVTPASHGNGEDTPKVNSSDSADDLDGPDPVRQNALSDDGLSDEEPPPYPSDVHAAWQLRQASRVNNRPPANAAPSRSEPPHPPDPSKRPPVSSRQPDGRVIFIDRDAYDHRREESFRNRMRYSIGGPPTHFG